MDASRQTGSVPHAEAITKEMPSRSRVDSERDSNHRSRLRNALPGSNQIHRQQQHRESGQKHPRTHRQSAIVQSALELRPPINFEHLLRRDKKTPISSSQPERPPDARNTDDDLSNLQVSTRRLRERVGAAELSKAREDNEKREEELRSALHQVEDQSMQSTRELDNTYYILLEKAEMLRDIVNNMQKLAKDSRQLCQDFQGQRQSLQTDITETISGYKEFNQQEATIKGLLDKLKSHKDRTSSLNERLDKARHRAGACEQRVLDAQSQRKKRWNITWAMILSVVVIIFAVIIVRQRPQLNQASSAYDVVLTVLARPTPSPSEDPYLHNLFDGIS